MQTLYLNQAQTKELLAKTNPSCYVQFLHYVAIAHQTNPNMEDAQLSRLLGYTISTVERNRLALTKAGWFLRKARRYNGNKTVIYFVGEEAVAQAKGNMYVSKY